MTTEDNELFVVKLTLISSPFPLLVVIKITPFAPLDPYIAVAEASFKTTNVSISFGLIRFNGLAEPAIPPLSNGTPSITINGSLLAFIEVPPLILIVLPEPGAPLLELIFTPGTLPITNCSGVVTEPLLKSSLLITAADPVKSLVLAVP